MKAKSYKRLDFIEVTDEEEKVSYICNNCKEEDYNSCFLWTDKDCREYLKQNQPIKKLPL